MVELKVSPDFAGVRLDKFLRTKLDRVPVSHLFKMIRVKKVRVNGKRGQPDQPLAEGDVVTVRGEESRLLMPEVEKAPVAIDLREFKVLFEDDWIIVIDKPSGLAVHPGSGIKGATVVELARAYLGPKAVRNEFAASPAHRLDRETSGLLVVAKRRPAMVHFTDVFTHHKAKKRYLTLVKGRMPESKGVIDLPLAEHQQTRESKERRGVNLQAAVTRWKVLRQNDELAFVECAIETGRTHQIRRHFAAIGHPLAGDAKHGDFHWNRELKATHGLKRLFLHATHLEFPHPSDQQRVVLDAPLPAELSDMLRRVALMPAT